MKLYSCHACGGSMEWDGQSGGLKCKNCGTTVKVEDTEALGYHPYETLPEFMSLQDYPEKVIQCPGCGAEIKADAKTVSMGCPYCGASLVLDEKQLSFAKPDGVAPVMISGDRVRQLVKEWCGKHMFAPNLASAHLEVKFVSPQYIPFWVFRAHVRGEYSGRGGKDRTVTRKNDDGTTVTRTVTDWYPIHGTVSDDLENFGVSADENINKEYADFLFDSTPDDAFAEWKPEYFAGSYSFIPTVPVEDAEEQAKDDMKSELESRTESDLRREYDHVEFSSFDVEYSDMAWLLDQIPGYFVICRYHGGIYVDVVNGVTGEIHGTYPVSFLKVAIAFILAAAASFAAFAFFVPESVSVCTNESCRFSWGVFGTSAAIFGVIALIVYVCIHLWLKGRVLGRDELQKNPWLAEIIEKIK